MIVVSHTSKFVSVSAQTSVRAARMRARIAVAFFDHGYTLPL